MRNAAKGALALMLAIFVLGLDQYTKWYTNQYIPLINPHDLVYPYNGIGVFENFLGVEFSISHVKNRGAAWGAFSDHQIVLIYVRLALIVGLICYSVWSAKAREWWLPLALIIAGACSNVLDYFLYGHVIDMFHFVLWGYDFAVFNIADSSVFLGVTWISFHSLRAATPEIHENHPLQRF